MRALKETGWINFRMRAMLVSFLTFNLDQDWREGVYHMAKLFLDYEPGIHFTQFVDLKISSKNARDKR